MTDTTPDRTLWAPRLSTGDPGLIARLKRAAGAPGNFHTLSVAVVSGGTARFAALGTEHGDAREPATEHTAFEIGSATKVLTGMLLAGLAERGTVAPDTTVAELLPSRFTGRPAGRATLVELASHRSGLPRLHHRSLPVSLRDAYRVHRGRDPYRGIDRDSFLQRAAAVTGPAPAGGFDYSNLGMSLLGHALAAAAHPGHGYGELLERELLAPLGMDRTRVVATEEERLPDPRALPHDRDGRPVQPWISEGYAPSGSGVWSTAGDLARLLLAVIGTTAPGADAARPRFEADGPNRIGLGWLTLTRDGQEVTWHNGGTGGSRSFIGFDRRTGRGAVVLANTGHDVDGIGAHLVSAGE
ncbi:serine hydrolase domain-containing protein [Streptomyces sp. NPDC001985]|uniref:serine hydrolase domain-containing protein n=1 Tax=Streptomyces sp. NPDC001985 TaxID=3154406 RepID=UPI0033222114